MMDHPLPTCCQTCRFQGSEWNEWSDTTEWYCERNVFFPVKKKTCKVKDADTLRRNGRKQRDLALLSFPEQPVTPSR